MHALERFRQSRAGNVAMLFALSVIPVLGFVSLSIDFTRAGVSKERLQSLIDGAVLAGAALPGSVSTTEVKGVVENMLRATTQDRSLKGVTFSVEADALSVSAIAWGSIETSFSRVLGVNDITVASTAKAQRPRTAKADIALVLDNTGSMNWDNRLTSLKAAVSGTRGGLTTALRTAFAARPNDVRVSVIPFSVGVRLPAVSAAMANVITPYPGIGWSGCIADRNANHDVLNVMPVASDPNTHLPRRHPNRSTVSCPGTFVAPLTSDLAQIDTQVNAMVAAGNTNTTVGLFWGRQSLQHQGLLPGGALSTTTDLTRYLILLTDGDNTQSFQWTNATPIDNKMLELCASIRRDNIVIYTIALGDSLSATSLRNLESCAGHPDRAKLARDPGDLTEVFEAIASDVQKTRLLN